MLVRIPRLISYLFMLIFCLLLLFFLRSRFLLILSVVFVIFPIVSFVVTLKLKENVNIRIRSGQPWILVGETGILSICIENTTLIPSLGAKLEAVIENPFIGSLSKHQIQIGIASKGVQKMELPLKATRIGYVEIRLEKIWIQDVLGLFQFQINPTVKDKWSNAFFVFPKGRSIKEETMEYLMAGVSESEESNMKGNDFSQVGDLREYIPGDRLKDIHWKISAKKEKLMVKEKLSVSQSQLIVLPDLSGSSEQREQIIEETWSVCQTMLEYQTPVTLLWWAEKMQEFKSDLVDSIEKQNEVFQMLFREYETCEVVDLEELFRRCQPVFGNCIIVTMQETEVVLKLMECDGY